MSTEKLEDLIEPKLYEAFVVLSKDDAVLSSVLKHTSTTSDFINALLACTVCLVTREREAQKMIIDILKANPEVKKLLELKNDTSMLPKK
jgi:hypothetical protein